MQSSSIRLQQEDGKPVDGTLLEVQKQRSPCSTRAYLWPFELHG